MYLGDAQHLRAHLPHPNAAIFVHDFQGDYAKLAAYLTYLTINETAYEEHRAWRKTFSNEQHVASKPLLHNSWFCRVCQWVVEVEKNVTVNLINGAGSAGASGAGGAAVASDGVYVHTPLSKRTHICPNATAHGAPVKAPGDWEGKAVRGAGSRQVYVVKEGALRGVPDADTFIAMGFSFEKVMVVGDKEVEALWIGDPLPRIAG